MDADAPLPPSTWPARQRDLRARFAAGADDLPRTEVFWRGIAAGSRSLLRQLRGQSRRPRIALWVEEAEPGAPAMLIFEVAELPALAGGHGTVVGELDVSGALALVLDDGMVVWPTYNPRVPAFNAPRR